MRVISMKLHALYWMLIAKTSMNAKRDARSSLEKDL